MPKVTLVEAYNLLSQIEERIENYRTLVRNLLDSTRVEGVEITKTDQMHPEEVKKVEKDLGPNPQAPKMSLEELETKLDELYVERNRLMVAMKQFKSTEQFNY